MSNFLEERMKAMAQDIAQRSPDGIMRDPAAEERINAACRAALGSGSGKLVMDYLRSITLNTVLPPSATDGELRMQEGMRRLFGILERRVNSTTKE